MERTGDGVLAEGGFFMRLPFRMVCFWMPLSVRISGSISDLWQ